MPPASADRRTGATRDADAVRARLLEALSPVITATGYDLEDVTVTSAGRRSLVRVIVDSDQGVDLDAIADVSRAVSEALDERDSFAGPFVLEVSSPGVDRPLSEQRHWRRATGRLVTVSVGEDTLTGRIVSTSDTGVILSVDGTTRELDWAELGNGRVQVEFNRRDTAGED